VTDAYRADDRRTGEMLRRGALTSIGMDGLA
jgi:hypothetical protein